jgi:dynamin 1-like protein
MERLIPVMNRLQDVLSTCEVPGLLALPQIVVVGSQSAGKSSVLESIVGRDFLPRGTGIVTRRPLILQCVKSSGADYAEFGHLPDVRFQDFDDVRVEIEQTTKDLVGENRGISALPIKLRVFSSKVVDITLVDLPGIVVNPVGDQPHDIESQVRDMILSYISHPNSLILAISPANVDIANSEAIKLAREVDPKGDRTLGVLTKIDCLGSGEDVTDILEGRVLPLRLGYVGMICRSQADILNKVKVEEHLAKEAQFFSSRPAYQHIADRLGTPYLSKRLNFLLMRHICDKIPSLQANISQLLQQHEQELKLLGEPISGVEAQKTLLLAFLDKVRQAYCDSVDGRAIKNITVELTGGSRIKWVFNELYRKALNSIDPFKALTDQDIRTAMMNAAGSRGTLFIPELAFELLVKNQIEYLRNPSLHCISFVFDELKALVNKLDLEELDRFDNLRDSIVEVVRTVLSEALLPTQQMVLNLIEIEQNYINTQHPDFISANTALQEAQSEFDTFMAVQVRQPSPPPAKQATAQPEPAESQGFLSRFFGGRSSNAELSSFEDLSQSPVLRQPPLPRSIRASEDPSNRELVETIVIKKLIESYFLIVRKNLGDSVPKAIMTFLVNRTKGSLYQMLVKNLYKVELLDHLLNESGTLHQRRLRCVEAVEQLRAASEVLNELRDMRDRV